MSNTVPMPEKMIEENAQALREIREDVRKIHETIVGSYTRPGLAERVRRLELFGRWIVISVGSAVAGLVAWVWNFVHDPKH